MVSKIAIILKTKLSRIENMMLFQKDTNLPNAAVESKVHSQVTHTHNKITVSSHLNDTATCFFMI